MEEAADLLSLGVINILMFFVPEVVVLSGVLLKVMNYLNRKFIMRFNHEIL